VLVPQADRAAPDLVQALTAAGAQVTSVTAYHTRLAPPAAEAQRALAGGVDAVTFASPSAAEGWASFGLLTPPLTACIGPTTAAAAQATGLTVDVVAPHPHTWVALLEALEQYWTPAKDLP
jgi:uroporphyrinogen-III synthase